MTVITKRQRRQRRRYRVRAKVSGTAQRPRLSVYRSNRGIFAQLIDDVDGKTLAAANWTESELSKLSGPNRRRRPASCWPNVQRRLGSRRASSIAAVTATTAGSRHSPREQEKAGLSFDVFEFRYGEQLI